MATPSRNAQLLTLCLPPSDGLARANLCCHDLCDLRCHTLRFFVRPESQDGPAFLTEPFCRVLISILVASNLRCPVTRVCLGWRMMFPASMPEAAITKNHDPDVPK